MGKIWYLSPSNQAGNLGVGSYGSEQEQMYLLVSAITPHLDRAGVFFHVADADASGPERCQESNALGAGFHLCLHSNAGGGGLARGPVALYYSAAGRAFCQGLVARLLALGQENNRAQNLVERKDLLELFGTIAPAALLEVDFHDSPAGADFIVSHRQQIAQAIAEAIIQADGKEFVPVTPGEYIDRAVSLGLFPQDTDWAAPLTKEEAAALGVRLKTILERG